MIRWSLLNTRVRVGILAFCLLLPTALGQAPEEKSLTDPQDRFEECMRWWRQPETPGYDEKAAHWCALAADQGHPAAQGYLGIFYDLGRGVEKDDREAKRWLRRAALKGDLQAAYYLGNLYYSRRDYGNAAEWTRMAALRGHIKAMNNLAHLYYHGEGVERNPLYAYLLFEPSLFEGNWVADSTRRRIRDELLPAERELVQTRRDGCHVYMRRFDRNAQAVLGRIIDDGKILATLKKALDKGEAVPSDEGAMMISGEKAFRLHAFQDCSLPVLILADNGYLAVRQANNSWVYYRDAGQFIRQLEQLEQSPVKLLP